MTPPEQASPLAASPEADALRLELTDRAKAAGATRAVIGSALGMSGREAKRHAHKLRERARRSALIERVMDEELPRYAETLERLRES